MQIVSHQLTNMSTTCSCSSGWQAFGGSWVVLSDPNWQSEGSLVCEQIHDSSSGGRMGWVSSGSGGSVIQVICSAQPLQLASVHLLCLFLSPHLRWILLSLYTGAAGFLLAHREDNVPKPLTTMLTPPWCQNPDWGQGGPGPYVAKGRAPKTQLQAKTLTGVSQACAPICLLSSLVIGLGLGVCHSSGQGRDLWERSVERILGKLILCYLHAMPWMSWLSSENEKDKQIGWMNLVE